MKKIIAMLMALVMSAGMLFAGETEPPPTPAEEQPEVLNSGPVNEAYAEPVNLENQTGLTVPTEPPAVIDEAPPADRPVGDQFVWIPGYWAWDSDRNGYIWVSGCWRAAPPSMYWVPGYWARTPDGWQWVSGFWSPVNNSEIEYLPAPPVLADVEPVGVAPSPDRIWVPPCWYWRHGQYIRRSGYWIAAQADWVWVPSHYVWTPRGYVFVSGLWDYSLSRRGVLFAPVYFPRYHYRGRFSLSIVVDTGNFEFSLFTYPRYCHYYFGDFFDNVYIGIGIFPWFECERRHGWYDPIYYHDRWRHHRDRPDWYDYHRHEYERRRDDRDLRPPRTYREMESRASRLPEAQRRDIEMARPISTVVKSRTSTMKFEQIRTADREKIEKRAGDVHKFGQERSHWESQGRREGAERVPEAQRRERGAPEAESKRPEVKQQERREVPSPAERKGPEVKPQERRAETPKAEERNRPESKEQERKAPETKPEQQKPVVSPTEGQSERVKVPTPPVVGRQGGIFRQGPPSNPKEEQKAVEKEQPRERPPQKNENRKDGDTSRNRRDRG